MKHKIIDVSNPFIRNKSLVLLKEVPFKNSIDKLKNIVGCKSPIHKLKVIEKTCESINDEISNFYEYLGISIHLNILDYHEILPILMYISC